MAQSREDEKQHQQRNAEVDEGVNDQVQFAYEQSGELTDFPPKEKEMRKQES
ncbi:hypothetical protein [Desmospora activa]|uniref:Uncharacterized protein n=1 Tax=Desmospora activa DSM 45169 TaxID=1121389 RepID=A0A2T4ZDV3_9BACL|nr:hypothetical protein [Desmospora activa]PTM60059.1 hypothetical protein C8J48_2698 [Desmospora activa DSM 45169]